MLCNMYIYSISHSYLMEQCTMSEFQMQKCSVRSLTGKLLSGTDHVSVLHFTYTLNGYRSHFFFNNSLFLFIYFWLCWVFISVRGLSLVAASGGHSSSRCAGLSLSRPLLLQSIGSRCAGSVVVAHGPSCSAACGILPDQGSNPCPLHWQADSQPLRHQGSPTGPIFGNFL